MRGGERKVYCTWRIDIIRGLSPLMGGSETDVTWKIEVWKRMGV